MHIAKTLKVFLIAQVLLYTWAMQILYASSHDGQDTFAGLGAVIPLGIFAFLGFVNIVLLIIHTTKVVEKKSDFDVAIPLLVIVVVGLVICYGTFVNWALSGPG